MVIANSCSLQCIYKDTGVERRQGTAVVHCGFNPNLNQTFFQFLGLLEHAFFQ